MAQAKKMTAAQLDKWTREATNDAQYMARIRVALKRAERGAYSQSAALDKLLEEYRAIVALRRMVKPGDTLYTVLRHVSASGMMRHIDVYKLTKNGKIYLSGYIAAACDYQRTREGAIKAGGCGMDMGFSIVYNASSVMFRRGHRCTGKTEKHRCRSNDHSNGEPYTTGIVHRDGGYAISHAWL